MKKFILLLSMLPWLLPAQVPENGRTGKASMLWTDRSSVMNGITLRVGTVDNLPDSTYTYYSGALHRRMAIRYDEEGRVVLEEGYTDYDRDGLVNDALKIEYTYTYEDGFFTGEGISYYKFYGDDWFGYSRAVTRYNANGQPVRTALYFPGGDGEWELNQFASTVEYDGRGNPTVVMDSIPYGDGLKAIKRHELQYDGSSRLVGHDVYTFTGGETEGEWVMRERSVITYGANMHTETYLTPTGIDYLIETLYDERGNVIAETAKKPGGDGGYTVLWSDTYRHVYLADGATPVILPERSRSSAVYPNPSTDYVTVTLEDAETAEATLVDLSGRIVGRQTVGRQATVAVYSLPRGLYLLKVQTAKGTDVHKLVIK
ncbi:MAG: T9SS type A sorting domain-containing protein [Tannerella sp.]|nr:T9SS type A sorting domain-containing protein [Tannerella sp.]